MGEIFQKIAGQGSQIASGIMGAVNAFKSGDIAGGIKGIFDTICQCCGGGCGGGCGGDSAGACANGSC